MPEPEVILLEPVDPAVENSTGWTDGDDAVVFLYARRYPDGEYVLVLTVYDLDADDGKTFVAGGPLHGVEDLSPKGDRGPHHQKWVWRAAHAHLTHPEWFRPRRRGRPIP